MATSTNFVKFINKQLSHSTKKLNMTRTAVIDRMFISVSYLCSLLTKRKYIPVIKLATKSTDKITINCLGCIDLQSDTELFSKDLHSVQSILKDADISLACSKFGKHSSKEYKSLHKHLTKNHIADVAYNNKFIKSTIYHTPIGKVAVCACMLNYASAAKHHIRLELLQEYYMLKRLGADYVIVYIDNKHQKTITQKNKRLCNLLLKAGVDYIVNIKSGLIDSGVTFRQKNGSVSRAIYSAGTFLSNRDSFHEERVAIRIKLRNVNNKLQAFEECYHPLRCFKNRGLKNLIVPGAVLSSESVAVLSNIERSMSRLRRADRILTIGKIMEVIGAKLPEQYQYLHDFSVGTISAKAIGRVPGDVYFCWQPYTDPNDKLTFKERQKSGIMVAKRLKNTVMFIVTYTDLKIKTPNVIVPNTLEAHIALCKYLRSLLNVKTIAITGSIGKTSTKDMISEVMRLHYKTIESQKNENTHTRISLNVQNITSEHEVYIQEMGGGRPGGASRHSRMITPQATVVTNIGDAHLGNFYGDKESLMRNKLEIIEGMSNDGVLYINGDDPLLVNANPDCKKVLFAVHNHNADYYAENIVAKNNQTTFNIVHNGRRVSAKVNAPGEHNVLNAVCAFAIGKQFKIPEETIVQGLANFKTQGIRQNIVQACGVKLFLDCYNASSGSVESSIKTLKQINIPKHGKRIALIGDITGLGEFTESTHKEIAKPLIENPADVFIFYGKDVRYTYEIVKQHGLTAHYVSKPKALYKLLHEVTLPGDIIMAKGSSKMKLEYALDCVFGTRFFDGVLLDDNGYYRAISANVTYNLFNSHATAVAPQHNVKRVKVKSRVGAVTVYNISSTFRSPNMEHVKLPHTIRHIGINAFRDSKKLKRIDGAKNLKYIGMAAFKNCASLEKLELPDTLLHIGNDAFMGCTSLKELYIPESVVQIGPHAFDNCPNLKLTCKKGSYADIYLRENNYPYTFTDK